VALPVVRTLYPDKMTDRLIFDFCVWLGVRLCLKPRPRQQQCRRNVRLCWKNRSTCSIRQCCFDIVVQFNANCICTEIAHVDVTFSSCLFLPWCIVFVLFQATSFNEHSAVLVAFQVLQHLLHSNFFCYLGNKFWLIDWLIVPQILSWFKISSTGLLALQRSKN